MPLPGRATRTGRQQSTTEYVRSRPRLCTARAASVYLIPGHNIPRCLALVRPHARSFARAASCRRLCRPVRRRMRSFGSRDFYTSACAGHLHTHSEAAGRYTAAHPQVAHFSSSSEWLHLRPSMDMTGTSSYLSRPLLPCNCSCWPCASYWCFHLVLLNALFNCILIN